MVNYNSIPLLNHFDKFSAAMCNHINSGDVWVCQGDNCKSTERTNAIRHYRCKLCYWVNNSGGKLEPCVINREKESADNEEGFADIEVPNGVGFDLICNRRL